MSKSLSAEASRPLPVLHVSASREDHGGIQGILRHHHEFDGDLGLDPRFVSLFDRAVTWEGACRSLGCHGWQSIGSIRRQFAEAVEPWADSLVIYHDGWGLRWFVSCDRAFRRIVFLHTERPHADDLVRTFAPRVDGFFCVSRSFLERVRRLCPDFPPERLCLLPLCVESAAPRLVRGNEGSRGGPLRIGFAGRVERGAKRLDRLPDLMAAMDRLGLDFRFDVSGDGSYLPALRRRFASDPRVRFLGWQANEAYRRTVASWDVFVLVSDYEGFSRAVMECMCCGVIPVHPDFSPAAVELLGPAGGIGLYPTGDMEAAAKRIAAISRMDPDTLNSLRRQCAAHLADHTVDRYHQTYRRFLDLVTSLPPRAISPLSSHFERILPLGAYTRLFPRRF